MILVWFCFESVKSSLSYKFCIRALSRILNWNNAFAEMNKGFFVVGNTLSFAWRQWFWVRESSLLLCSSASSFFIQSTHFVSPLWLPHFFKHPSFVSRFFSFIEFFYIYSLFPLTTCSLRWLLPTVIIIIGFFCLMTLNISCCLSVDVRQSCLSSGVNKERWTVALD